MNFLDLFAGIGGFRLGMEQAGHKCIGYVEFDKFARQSYEAMHDTKGEWTKHDITTVTDDDIRQLRDSRRIDAICGGFPCQAFSIAGKRKGFDDTRGTLFFDIMRFASIIRPSYLFLENVKGLMSHDNGNTFETILRTMDELGYDAEWDVLNSKDFGVPQNRERVFIIGHLRNGRGRKVFPVRGFSESADINIIGTTKNRDAQGTNCRHWLHDSNGSVGALSATDYKQPKQIMIRENTKKGYVEATVGDGVRLDHPSGTTGRGRVQKQSSQTMTTSGNVGCVVSGIYTNASKDFQRPPLKNLSRTLKSGSHDAGVTDGLHIRKLTPKECFRLQGFPDELFERAAEVNSNSQLYKQAGNSVTVNVIYEIAKKLELIECTSE